MNNKQIEIAILGTGGRGNNYSEYLLKNPTAGKIIAAADTDPERLANFAAKFGVPESGLFSSYQDFLKQPGCCDAVVICLQDSLHFDAVMAALDKGYHVLLEKPMSYNPEEIMQMTEKAEEAGVVMMICHVLRYTPFFETLKSLLSSGKAGEIVSINLIEHVGNIHFSHSFVRGNWGNSERAGSILMSKSCHDVDILRWLVDKPCTRVSSFGSLTHFHPGQAPEGSTARCTDGCAVERSCVYSAKRIYLEQNFWHKILMIPDDKAARLKAIQEGPYGRCVYQCDNDVADHQTVMMEYEEGITATFTLIGLSREGGRTIEVYCTEGQIRGNVDNNEIKIAYFNGDVETIVPREVSSGHGGGDDQIMEDFLIQVRNNNSKGGRTSARVSAESHMIALAAEQARLQGKVISLNDFPKEYGL